MFSIPVAGLRTLKELLLEDDHILRMHLMGQIVIFVDPTLITP